ncbi:MAG: serine hydrolase [Planctomycetota bacterium]
MRVRASRKPPFVSERFAPITKGLRQFAERQRREHGIPGIWIALLEVDPVGGTRHLWADAVAASESESGEVAPDVLATHRVASISKLFTDTAAMVLVERGLLDLDADVRSYLPELTPENRWGTPITLRHLMGHRAGLVRESPVGHYFDATEPSLADTVASLAKTALVTEPGTQWKYSNPAIGAVGEIVARALDQPFEDAVRSLVLTPLGLRDSDFAARSDLVERQAKGVMWTYDGREIATPNFRFGYVPAAELRSTTIDLVKFASSWFAGAEPRVLSVAAQQEMWRLPEGEARGCGLGFFVGQLAGHRRVTHGGAVYGFASTIVALPEQGLACAVVCTKDFVNDVADTVADRALLAALANRRGEVLPPPVYPEPLGVAAARALQGHYTCGEEWVELYERGGELYYDPNIGVRTRMRRLPDGSLVADDPMMTSGGRRLVRQANGNLHDGKVEYLRDPAQPAPAPAPTEIVPLLGEYGWDHNALVVYEDHGRLAVLIEWLVRDLPDREGDDVYSFPPGLYHDDLLRFDRNERGAVVAATVGGARFPLRAAHAERGQPYRMPTVRPVAEIVAQARRATPPAELLAREPGMRAFELVDLAEFSAAAAPSREDASRAMQFDVRYAGDNNFLGAKVYDRAVAKLQRPAAEALQRAHAALAAHGVGIKVFDAYRPWWVTKVFWDAAPADQKIFVADPSRGSRHNRGCAVDVTLVELDTGREVAMPSGFDEFTERAYSDYPGGTSRQRHFRALLRRAMEAEGFSVYEQEWWHFDYRDWRQYPVGNEPL